VRALIVNPPPSLSSQFSLTKIDYSPATGDMNKDAGQLVLIRGMQPQDGRGVIGNRGTQAG
jgi:hypothetical protein